MGAVAAENVNLIGIGCGDQDVGGGHVGLPQHGLRGTVALGAHDVQLVGYLGEDLVPDINDGDAVALVGQMFG